MDCASFTPPSLRNTSDSISVGSAAVDGGSGVRVLETDELPEDKDCLVDGGSVEFTDRILSLESFLPSLSSRVVLYFLERFPLERPEPSGERERRIFRRNPSIVATSHTERYLCMPLGLSSSSSGMLRFIMDLLAPR